MTVLTGIPNYPDGQFFQGYGYFKNKRQDYHGARVVRIPILSRGKAKGIRLFLNYLSFVFFASLLGPLFCREKYDLIFVFEPSPITVCLPAIVMKKIKRAPIAFFVLDLWPESLSATGAVKSHRILHWVEKLTKFIYRHCDHILVPSKAYFGPIIKLGVRKEKISYFPNSADELYKPVKATIARNQLGLPEGFTVMYAGNIGVAQDFPTIISAAERLKNHSDIHWVILGDGRMFSWTKEQIQQKGLTKTVHLLGRHPLSEMPTYFSFADVMLVTLKRDPIFALTVPARIQAYMACGRPIIAVLDGEGARIVEEARAGATCSAESPDLLADTVMDMHRRESVDRQKLGENGRKYFEAYFERNHVIDQFFVVAENLLSRRRATKGAVNIVEDVDYNEMECL